MKRTLTKYALGLAIALGSVTSMTVPVQSIAAPSIDIQSVLQQERAWARLETKRLKVGDIDWAYSEGGASR